MFSYEWLRQQAGRLGINLSDEQLTLFSRYEELLVVEGEKFNLTAADSKRLIPDHFLDSLTAVVGDRLRPDMTIIDIGSGAGLPGIPLKIAFPGLRMTLLEARRKRADFLRGVVAELELDRIEVAETRTETAGHNPIFREQSQLVVARAVAPMKILLEYALPLLAVGGALVALKGPLASAEAAEAEAAALLLGGSAIAVLPVDLIPEKSRYVVVVDKISGTPAEFPRRIGIPSKRPLK